MLIELLLQLINLQLLLILSMLLDKVLGQLVLVFLPDLPVLLIHSFLFLVFLLTLPYHLIPVRVIMCLLVNRIVQNSGLTLSNFDPSILFGLVATLKIVM